MEVLQYMSPKTCKKFGQDLSSGLARLAVVARQNRPVHVIAAAWHVQPASASLLSSLSQYLRRVASS